ncbi:MAG: hypothetical protein LHV69_09575 [Elusimicrobia bacterium]|nr:hypothetical protein [Candidatus Obscuribacterium magneticum]
MARVPGSRQRAAQKKKHKSVRKNRYSLEERHRLGLSATARAFKALNEARAEG